MSTTGEIRTLYSDREQTQAVFPRTKVSAVSDDNGTGLNVLLDNKAPAGYGLGDYCKQINSWNNAYSCGWYSSMGDAPDNEAFWHGIVSVDPNTGRLIQRVWKANPTLHSEFIRFCGT